jgi:predicted acyl esterase
MGGCLRTLRRGLEGMRASGRGFEPSHSRFPIGRFARVLATLAVACTAAALAPAMASAAPMVASGEPFASVLPGGEGLTCETGVEVEEIGGTNVGTKIAYEGDVRFCRGNGETTRVPSWDGVPLDVDVTLPPESDGPGPYPTIVMLHGYGSTKTNFESPTPTGDGNEIFDYNNDYFAQQGYAVVNYTARGFGKSCGLSLSTTEECAANGFIHLVDQRYEAHDTQYLLGLLAEEGIANPGELGVTGISYGGGQSITLAYLKNRIECAGPVDEEVSRAGVTNPCVGQAENALVPWKNAEGEELEIKAAYARWPWSDIANSLNPNGRFLEYDPATYDQDGAEGTDSPVGVPLTSYQQGLYADGVLAEGYYEPITGSLEWNLSKSLLLFEKPEPENKEDQEIITDLSKYHGGFAVPSDGEPPAPLLMESGWNDDLFPPEETLRVYNSVREEYPGAYVALQYGDVGHSRGTNRAGTDQYFDAQGAAFFDEELKGESTTVETLAKQPVSAPEAGDATAFNTTCTATEDEGPFEAEAWEELHPGMVTFASATEQTVTNPAETDNQLIGGEFDPILQEEGTTPKVLSNESGACKSIPALEPEGTASYLEPVEEEITMMGLPTISAEVSVSGTKGENGEIDGRLWDVTPGATPSETTERLISRGDFRLEEPQTPKIVFQLHGNGYKLEEGHFIKLELTTSDYPYYYASEAPYSVEVKNVHVYLPTYTAPNGGQVEAPVVPPLPEAPLTKPKEEAPKAKEEPKPKEEPYVKAVLPAPKLAEEPVTKTEEKGTASQCSAKRKVTIKLPKYKNGKVTKVVVMLKGKKVKTVTVKKGSLKSVSYTFKGSVSGKSTLKLKLTVKQTKKSKTTTSTKKLSRNYDLCAAE